MLQQKRHGHYKRVTYLNITTKHVPYPPNIRVDYMHILNGNANDLECLGGTPLAMIPPHALTHLLNSIFVQMGH
jgi:hypothetical protein